MQRRGIVPEGPALAALIELRGLQGDTAGAEELWARGLEGAAEEGERALLHAARVIGLAR